MESLSRIAVVEDDPEISRMMTDYMTDHGFEVTAARSGRDLDRVMSGGKDRLRHPGCRVCLARTG